MDIKDLVESAGYAPRKKAASHGGEYCSPCPFCKEGDDRFLIWPQRHNKDGSYTGGRFSCPRHCEKSGDAISFLCLLYGVDYKTACAQLHIIPKKRNGETTVKPIPHRLITKNPTQCWMEKATSFTGWANKQLERHPKGLELLHLRGFRDDVLSSFGLGYNPQTLFRERIDWGLAAQIKKDGKSQKLWLPAGIVIPTFANNQVIKVKIRRSEWKRGDEWPKYVEVSGSKQSPSVFGNTSLSIALVIESEIDSLLIQQELSDLVFCVALGGSTKPLDLDTYQLLRKTQLLLFLPDIDEAGAVAWLKWKKLFPNIRRILSPYGKSAGDYFQLGGNLREWLQELIRINSKE